MSLGAWGDEGDAGLEGHVHDVYEAGGTFTHWRLLPEPPGGKGD